MSSGWFLASTAGQGIWGIVRVGQPISRSSSIHKLIRKAVRLGQLSRQEHLQLTSAILSDLNLDPINRSQINRLLDYIHMGRVKLVD